MYYADGEMWTHTRRLVYQVGDIAWRNELWDSRSYPLFFEIGGEEIQRFEFPYFHCSCTMPSVEVGTVGGGTVLPPQGTCLEVLHDRF